MWLCIYNLGVSELSMQWNLLSSTENLNLMIFFEARWFHSVNCLYSKATEAFIFAVALPCSLDVLYFPSIFLTQDQSFKSTEPKTTSSVARHKNQTTKYPIQGFGVLDKLVQLKELGAISHESWPIPESITSLGKGSWKWATNGLLKNPSFALTQVPSDLIG